VQRSRLRDTFFRKHRASQVERRVRDTFFRKHRASQVERRVRKNC